MEIALRFAFGLFVILLVLAVGVWVMWRLLKNSEDPAALLFRWIITVVLVVGGYFVIDWIVGPNGGPMEKVIGLFAGMFLGLILAGLWVPAIVGKVSDLFGGLYTGGTEPPPPQPYYSIAETRRKQARYQEAIYEIQQQLEKFPTDVTGHVMLASVQAENLNDLPGAQLTIERFCSQPNHPPPHLAYALNALADWHLKAQDTDAARQALNRLIELLPETEQSRMASQRIAHFASNEMLLAAHEHKPITLRRGVQDLGLMKNPGDILKPAEDPGEMAALLIEHLNQHPLDNDAREKLAHIYWDHYQRLDLAAEQLEQLIATPNQSGKEVARWLNLLADMQVKYGEGLEMIRQTLQRVIDLFPGLAAAQMARQRIEYLPLELKGKEKSQAVKLGSYEKDIGLKSRRGS